MIVARPTTRIIKKSARNMMVPRAIVSPGGAVKAKISPQSATFASVR